VESELEYQLQLATEVYLEVNTKVEIEKGLVMISQLFKWYATDFGGTDSAILSWITNHLPEGEIKQQSQQLRQATAVPKIAYTNYDWHLNVNYCSQLIASLICNLKLKNFMTL